MEIFLLLLLLAASVSINGLTVPLIKSSRTWRMRRTTCPRDHRKALRLCRTEVIQLTRSGPRSREEICRVHLDSLACIEDIFRACANVPQVQDIANMMDIESMRIGIEQQCPDAYRDEPEEEVAALRDGCPGIQQFAVQFNKCANTYNNNAFVGRITRQRCWTATEALDCLERLTQRCGRLVLIRDFSYDRVNLRSRCSRFVEDEDEDYSEPSLAVRDRHPVTHHPVGEARKQEPCPPDYLEDIKRCDALSLSSPSHGSPLQSTDNCALAYQELQCLNDLVSRCFDQPVIQRLLHQWTPDEFEKQLNVMCRRFL